MEETLDSEYLVDCSRCHANFDTLAAAWCVCLTDEPTVVCPACNSCFCAETAEFKRNFWSAAPTPLWTRRAAEKRIRRAPSLEIDSASLARPLVLVVDDEPAMRKLAVFVLDRMGYGALTASDGEEALALARKHRPDLILSDALMPRTDGRELCRRVKSQPETSGVKFILMTSVYKLRRYEGEAYVQFGVDGFLPKPVGLTELKKELQRHLGTTAFSIPESRSEFGTTQLAAGAAA